MLPDPGSLLAEPGLLLSYPTGWLTGAPSTSVLSWKKNSVFWGLKKLVNLRGGLQSWEKKHDFEGELQSWKRNRVPRVPKKTVFFSQWILPSKSQVPSCSFLPSCKGVITCHLSVGLGKGKQEALLETLIWGGRGNTEKNYSPKNLLNSGRMTQNIKF